MADDTGASGSSASAAGSSPASSTATSATGSAAPATSAPTQSVAPDSGGSQQGPLPYERHKAILDGAYAERDTAKRAAEEYKQRYGWAEQFETNPYQFVEGWYDKLLDHPEYGPQLIARSARALASRRGAHQASAERPKADVPIMDAHGNVTGYTYSDKQQDALDEWKWQQREAKLAERFQPLETMRKAIEEQAQVAHIHQQSEAYAKTTLNELRQRPYFKEHESKVKAALMAHPEWGDNVHAAFNHVLVTEILPNLSTSEQAKVVANLQNKANASTVAPNGSAPTGKPKFKNFAEASKYYQEHPQEAEAMANR